MCQFEKIFLSLTLIDILNMNKRSVILRLSKIKETLSNYGVSSIGLFGSTVREENTPYSDIDILIDFSADSETFSNYIIVCDLLEKLFTNHKIDIVTKNGLSPYIGKNIFSEVEYV